MVGTAVATIVYSTREISTRSQTHWWGRNPRIRVKTYLFKSSDERGYLPRGLVSSLDHKLVWSRSLLTQRERTSKKASLLVSASGSSSPFSGGGD
jgi:hypothetical protein